MSAPEYNGGIVSQEWIKEEGRSRLVKYPEAGDALLAAREEILTDFRNDLEAASKAKPRQAPEILVPTYGPLCEIAIQDPHFGMLAWGQEVGEDQDINTIQDDYAAAAEHLVSLSRIYTPSRFVYLVGNDMAHVNQSGEGGKGGATKKGTQQDLDTRMPKIFTSMRQCAVAGIDLASSVAPVDVVIVPGNHDPDEAFRLGVVLDAWYRNHPHIRVLNAPRKRKFYGYERNAFMFTHGEEYKRKRDNLVTIMATECPADLWVASEGGSREIHTGHNHIRMQGGYYPTAEIMESRGIVVRSLPGITAIDAWHYEEGYQHRRAASLLTFHPDHGFTGLHEYIPQARTP